MPKLILHNGDDREELSVAARDGDVSWDYSVGGAPTNQSRADLALDAVYENTDFKHEPDSELPTYVVDLLTNLMHLCRLRGIDFGAALVKAYGQHEDERQGV